MQADADPAGADDLALVEFYTGGQHKPNGQDIRVAGEDGRLVACRVLGVGPGDRVRVVFALKKGEKRYFVYFGHPDPPAAQELTIRAGLLLEMRQWQGGPVGNFREIEQAWARSKNPIGQTMIDRPFVGYNPFDDQQRTISRLSGSLIVPADGEYLFAASADDRGALYMAGKPLLFVPGAPGDTRFNARAQLARGRHDFVFYHVNTGGEGRFSVVWRRPDQEKVEVIPREAFGQVHKAQPGPLEEIRKTLVGDFRMEYLGESFVANHYSHRVKFSAVSARAIAGTVKHEWDFGDGQTGGGAEVEHVYLADGVYPVRLTVRVGGNSDTRTIKVPVTRFYEQLDKPPTDPPPVHAKIVAGYDVARMPAAWLPRAVLLHLRTGQSRPMLATMRRLAQEKAHPEPNPALSALTEATRQMLNRESKVAMEIWDAIPETSNLQPAAARQHGEFLLWWLGDFTQAQRVLRPHAGKDADVRRLYAQALILGGKVKEGTGLLEELPAQSPPQRQAALSGAMARTIEYYINEGDWEAGEEHWERWSARHPMDFLEGYSLLLKTRLMELKKTPAAAASVAEAFALAVPQSSYAPRLLDRASRLLAETDPQKSQSLRQLLRQRYPEDPLSQEDAGRD